MANRFKFVNGDGGKAHEDALQAASKDGYVVKFVSHDPSEGAGASKPIVVLMEKSK
jgi:hypothetical protein